MCELHYESVSSEFDINHAIINCLKEIQNTKKRVARAQSLKYTSLV